MHSPEVIVDKANSSRAAVELSQAEVERLLRIVDAAPGVLYEFHRSPEGAYSFPYFNGRVQSLFSDLPTAHPSFEQMWALVPEEDQADLAASIEESARTMQPWRKEYRVKSVAGEIRWMRGESQPERLADGGILWRGYLYDVTEWRWSLAEQQRSESLLQQALQIAGIGTWEYDTDLTQLTWSQETRRLHEVAEDYKTEVPLALAFYPEPFREQVAEVFARACQQGHAFDLWGPLISAQGKKLTVRIMGEALCEGGRIVRIVGIIQDITKQREQEQLRENLEKTELVGQLAGNIAHDFNNLLTSITAGISLLRLEKGLSPVSLDILGNMRQAAQASQQLTHQLLTFSRGGRPVRKICDVAEVIRRAIKCSEPMAETKVLTQLDSNLWPVDADASQIEQVVVNLILNALQATQGQGQIVIQARNHPVTAEGRLRLEVGDYIEVAVQDNGPGIPLEIQPRVFAPYFTTKKSGSGLGLASAFSIIHRHGGLLTFESREQVGTTFYVYLKASPGTSLPEVETAPVQTSLRGRILCLEDNDGIREILECCLRRLGHEVDVSVEGGDCLRRYQQAQAEGCPYDIVILDIIIPEGMGGIETAKKLRQSGCAVPILACSGYTDNDALAHPDQYGFSGVIRKPFSLEDLSETVTQHLDEGNEAECSI